MLRKSVNERMHEFVEYHINGDGECNNIVLREYAERHKLTKQERFALSFFFAVCYCVESAVFMLRHEPEIRRSPKEWAEQNKSKIIFQSDRKYTKMLDHFAKSLEFYSTIDAGEVAEAFGERVVLKDAIPEVERWYFFGRFSAYLFLETYIDMCGLPCENTTIEWREGATATSGLMNVFGYDKAAEMFDAHKRLLIPTERLDELLAILAKAVERSGGDSNTTKLETSLCAYRKFYKGSRYNGFYLDRMLGEIEWYKKVALI